jgi:hypothetical protein
MTTGKSRYKFDDPFESHVRQHLSDMGMSQEDSSGIIACFQDTGYACSALAEAIQKSIPKTQILFSPSKTSKYEL